MSATAMSITTFLLLGLPAIPNLFGIWHAFHHDFPGPQERLKWLGACVFLPVLGGGGLPDFRHAAGEKTALKRKNSVPLQQRQRSLP
jgi:hypothetical protein